jgi:hypothetical protein
MPNRPVFFPRLERRNNYHVKRNGEYYEYHEYRQEIREDCLGRCVYCDAHENECGGSESIHLDHFRPQKYKEHAHLVNNPNNLVWCCSGCNRLKSDDWPALGMDDSIVGHVGYIDPFGVDRLEYFRVLDDGKLEALKPPAQYMYIQLALDRQSRKRLRELRNIKQKWLVELEQWVNELVLMLAADNLIDAQRASIRSLIERIQKQQQELEEALFDFQLH